MRWGVEYELPNGMVGLCLFVAEDEEAAQLYVFEMLTKGGHTKVFNLREVPERVTVEGLCGLFPYPIPSREPL